MPATQEALVVLIECLIASGATAVRDEHRGEFGISGGSEIAEGYVMAGDA